MPLSDDLEYFRKLVDMALRVHNTSRMPFGPCTEEGHFINQNTVIRIAEAAEEVRTALGSDWYATDDEDGIYYVTLKVYRDCILHNRGRMQAHLDDKQLGRWKDRYATLCGEMGVAPHERGDEIVLPAQPVIQTLLSGLQRFVDNQVRSAQTDTTA